MIHPFWLSYITSFTRSYAYVKSKFVLWYLYMCILIKCPEEKLTDTKGVIISRISENRHYNGQNKMV